MEKIGKLVGDTEVTSGIRQGCIGLLQFYVIVLNIVINSIIESKLAIGMKSFIFLYCSMLMIFCCWHDSVRRQRR